MKLLDAGGNPVLDGNGNPITDVTDGNGKYEFPGLPPGTYKVEFVPPAGFSFTQPNQGSDVTDSDADVATGRTDAVTLGAGDVDTTTDAGLVAVVDTAIGNMVWCDANADGVKQVLESAIANVTVRLYTPGPNGTPYDGDDVLLQTLVTDGSGRYVFLGLPAGQYYVAVVSATVPSGCNQGSSPGGGHNPDLGDQDLTDGDDGAPLKPGEVVSGVITTAVGGQTTPDTGNPIGYQDNSAYMTVDFGFTPTPTAVRLQDLRAQPASLVQQIIDLLRNWLK